MLHIDHRVLRVCEMRMECFAVEYSSHSRVSKASTSFSAEREIRGPVISDETGFRFFDNMPSDDWNAPSIEHAIGDGLADAHNRSAVSLKRPVNPRSCL